MKLIPLLKLGTRCLGKIPSAKDSLPEKLSKLLALADAIYETYGGKRSRMGELVDRYDLRERYSETFVKLFFATAMRDSFELRRYQLDDHNDIIEAKSPDGQRLYFRESRSGTPQIENDFHHTPGLDMAGIIDKLWAAYPSGLYLSVTTGQHGWGRETTICEAPAVAVKHLSRVARERIQGLAKAHAGHRCYLCLGEPGTGKSSFAALLARELGGRLLKLDASSLNMIGVRELGFLIETLRPRFMVIDDIDRAPIEEVGARILYAMEMIKSKYPGTAIVLTANDATKLDAALLRPGRIDKAIRFTLPDAAEREEMIRAARPELGVDTVSYLVGQTAGFAQAHMSYLCENVVDAQTILDMRNLLELSAQSAGASGAVPKG